MVLLAELVIELESVVKIVHCDCGGAGLPGPATVTLLRELDSGSKVESDVEPLSCKHAA